MATQVVEFTDEILATRSLILAIETFTKHYFADDMFGPFVELLLQNSANGILSEEQMRGELDVIVITGTQSISVTATFALVLLGIHPELQERVFKE